MPTSHVYVCDRCGNRAEGLLLSPGWCEIELLHGLRDGDVDPDQGPVETYLLCTECAPRAIRHLRESVSEPGKSMPTH